MTSTDAKGSSPDKKDDKSKDSKPDSSRRDSDNERRRSPPRDNAAVSRDTNRNDPRSLRCRVFIGNLPSDKVSRQELESMFMAYGPVIGCSVHTNFGFVQFQNEKDADTAVSKEHGRILHGKKVDVNLAGERQKKTTNEPDVNLAGDRRKGMRGEKRPHEFERGRERRSPPPRGGSPPRGGRHYDDFPPSRFGPPDDRFGRRGSPPRGDPFLPRDGPPRDHDDRYGDRRGEPFERYGRFRDSPERDPYYRRDGGPPFPDEPPPRRDPYYDRPEDRPPPRDSRDPFDDRPPPNRGERPPHDERYRDGYPERGEEFGRPHSRERDFPPPYGDSGSKKMKGEDDFEKSAYQKPGAPIDCEIIVVNKQQRGYADLVERRLKGLGLITLTAFLPEHKVISDALDDVSRRGILYAIVITSQHEVHRSVTVNILHGTSQEHRNMPLEDAMNLVGKNFDAYMQDLRERASSSSTEAVPSQKFSPEILQLLSSAATGKALTLDQVTLLINALQKHKDEMTKKDVAPAEKNRGPTQSPKSAQDAASIAKQQAELQARILSILNPGSVAASPATSSPSVAKTGTSPLPSALKKSPQVSPAGQNTFSSPGTRPQTNSSPYDNKGFAKPTTPAPRVGQSPTAPPAGNPYGQGSGRGYSPQQGYGQYAPSPVAYPVAGGYGRSGMQGNSTSQYGTTSNATAAATTLSNNPHVQKALDNLMQAGLPHGIGKSPSSRPVMPPGFPPYQR